MLNTFSLGRCILVCTCPTHFPYSSWQHLHVTMPVMRTSLELGKGMPVLHSQCGGAALFSRAAAAVAAAAAGSLQQQQQEHFAAENARHARRMRFGCLATWRRQAGSRSMQLGAAAACAAVEYRHPMSYT